VPEVYICYPDESGGYEVRGQSTRRPAMRRFGGISGARSVLSSIATVMRRAAGVEAWSSAIQHNTGLVLRFLDLDKVIRSRWVSAHPFGEAGGDHPVREQFCDQTVPAQLPEQVLPEPGPGGSLRQQASRLRGSHIRTLKPTACHILCHISANYRTTVLTCSKFHVKHLTSPYSSNLYSGKANYYLVWGLFT
jgi:hypothetical protein